IHSRTPEVFRLLNALMLYPLWIDYSFVIVLGLLLGSFTTCLVYRLPRDIPLWKRNIADGHDTRFSYCPHCDHRLFWYDLLPVLSWLFQGGKCRYCRQPISFLYPAIEITTVVFCLINFAIWQQWNGMCFLLMFTAPVIIGLFYIDALWRLLPDKLNLALAVFGLIWIGLTEVTLGRGLLASLLLAGSFWGLRALFWRFRQVEAMGLGDVKFVAAAGLWLGLAPLSVFLFLAGALGMIYALGYRLATREKLFPFGPALITAWWLCVILPYLPFKGLVNPLLLP
ncbi:MAG TPA: prepilin peptidase, partial [Alphaproteobacteria bacterium]